MTHRIDHKAHEAHERHLHGEGGIDHGVGHDIPHGVSHGSWIHDILEPLRGGRSAVRRGNVRPAILAALQERPMHGYQVIQDLEARSGGRWRPSAGSIYPTLQQLEDEGLVRSDEVDGRRTYTLTEAGAAAAKDAPLNRHPWFDKEAGREALDLRKLAVQLVGAADQVSRVGSTEAKDEARRILVESRRRMYRLLAEDEVDDVEEVVEP